ncbi:MAG TPA: M20 family metallopeptidase [Vicinamibacteria bacterium]
MILTTLLAAASAVSLADADIKARAEAMTPRLVETRRDIHRHPELGNREERTGRLVAERLRAAGLEVRHPVAKTGVVGLLKGGRPGAVVAVRADLDALPIEEKKDSPYKSENAGVMHACGHDAHTTIVLGAAELLAGMRAQVSGTVVFLFQPAEEGPPEGEEGGALLMLKEGVFDSPKVQAVYGLHMDPLLDVGTVGWSVGPIFASSDRFRIDVQGQRTHGAAPHTGLDPVPVAAEIVSALQLIVSRQIDAQNPKVLTIGQIHGGNRYNIIAGSVFLEGTLRTLDAAVRRDVKARMERTVKGVAEAHGTSATLTFASDGNPPTMNDGPLTRASLPGLERVYGKDRVLEVKPQMPAEDFAWLAERVPGLYVKMGVRNEARGIKGMLHTEEFDLDEAVLPLGVRAMATLVWDYLSRTK